MARWVGCVLRGALRFALQFDIHDNENPGETERLGEQRQLADADGKAAPTSARIASWRLAPVRNDHARRKTRFMVPSDSSESRWDFTPAYAGIAPPTASSTES
jgi:hypothetical protein